MTETAHTPGPWRAGASTFYPGLDGPMTMRVYTDHPPTEFEVTGDNITANARLIAAAPDLLAACRAMIAWDDAEKQGPDYGTQTRDTHPDGELIWRRWWGDQQRLCERAFDTARDSIARATGEKEPDQ